MTDWRSDVFRGLCTDRIEEARVACGVAGAAGGEGGGGDPVVAFLAQRTSAQLEEFVFNKSNTREDYLNYVLEMVQMVKQHGVGPAVTPGESQQDTAAT